MKFDFSKYQISDRGYSDKPMSFVNSGPSGILTGIVELALIETGTRTATARWQKAQLKNLLTHTTQRSAFWRAHLGSRRLDAKLGTLPVLTRSDVKQQVEQERSLLRPADGLQTALHTTSGSSGVPTQFYVSQMNTQYNHMRYLAQDFIEGNDLALNRTHIKSASLRVANELTKIPSGFTVKKEPSRLGEFGALFASGGFKLIECLNPNLRDLVRELRKDAVGQLVANPRLASIIIGYGGSKLLRELRVKEWLPIGEEVEPALNQAFTEQGIPGRSSYSSEEVGPIAFECGAAPGHYHVATSNVIVEVSDDRHLIEGKQLGRVLVTHLHSYATPFIRYDLGDLALINESCPCGHDGPTIHSLFGRLTNALKHRDGSLSAFYIRGGELSACVEFNEFRCRQVGFEEILLEVGGRQTLTSEEVLNVTAYLKRRAGDEFKVEVIACPAIDWGSSIKKLGFRCEI
jgi:phenylacetate-CoA ligase